MFDIYDITFIVGAAAFAFVIYDTFVKPVRADKRIPSPEALPIIGNALPFFKNFHRSFHWTLDNARKYGTFQVSLPGQNSYIFITDPKCVEHMLKTNFWNYEKSGEFSARFHELLGEGIFNIDGDKWRVARKMTSLMFNVKNFKTHMGDTFHKHSKLVDRLLSKASKSNESVDFHSLFHRYTLDSIGEIAFGVNIGSVDNPHLPISDAFDNAQECHSQRFFSPAWKLRKFIHPSEWKNRQYIQTLNEFANEVIRTRRAGGEDAAKRGDLLSLFMTKGNPDSGESFDDDYLRDLIMNMLIAGRDTTAQCLSWAVWEISKHPQVEERIVEELKEVMGDRDVPSYEDLQDLKYLHAVVTEALRLHPSVPRDGKMALADDVLPDGTKVTKGCWLAYVPWAMGRLESNWGKDAEAFRPERHLEDSKPNSYKFTAFQAGPRICLGQTMAYQEAKTMLATLYKKYHLEMEKGQNVTYRVAVTLQMKHPLMMKVVPRI